MSNQRANQLVEAGLWLRLSGDHEGAKRLFEQALRMDPANARAQRLLNEVPSGVFDPSELPAELRSQAAAVTQPPGTTTVVAPPSSLAAPAPSRPPPAVQPVAPSVRPVTNGAASHNRPRTEALMPDPMRTESVRTDAMSIDAIGMDGTEVSAQLLEDPTTGWDFKSTPGTSIPPSGAAEIPNPMDWAVEPERPPSEDSAVRREEVKTLLRGAQELIELDDHSGALELIIKAERISPADPQVRLLREKSERTLQAMYESKLGDLGSAPHVKLKDDEIIWLNLDHRAGFVLAQIDGGVTFEDVFAVSGMSRLDTARILVQLLDEGVIEA